MHKATLSLFNAIQVDGKMKSKKFGIDSQLLVKTIKDGYILSPEVARIADDNLLREISEVIGISGEKANAAFHKNWEVIQNSSDLELRMQQILHYITTYGFESMGIYSEGLVYVPQEVLNIPKLKEGLKLVVIKGLTADELREKIVQLGSGLALKTSTLEHMMTVIEKNYDEDIIKEVKNKELKTRLYDYFDICPSDSIEFLRYIVQKLTNESLLIKNKNLINKIKECDSKLHAKTLNKLIKQAPSDLASIFFRFKPIFLALKKISNDKTFFNRLRKQANSMHVPMEPDFINSVTGILKEIPKISNVALLKELDNVNIFRKIRLAYALKYRTEKRDSILYRVRNGRSYAVDKFDFDNQVGAKQAYNTVISSIIKSLNVEGKLIYLPEYINYALPATEKMFTGNFPTGSYVVVPENMIVGIHWFNGKNEYRVDLDLSTISASGKVGWDSNYRSGSGNVLFSGDMTTAPRPNGSSELFFIKGGKQEDKLMYVNYFNYSKDHPVEAKIMIGMDNPKNFGKDYMIDPNKIVAVAPITIDQTQQILGLIARVDGENRFYFAQTALGNNITSGYDSYSGIARKFLADTLIDSIDFREILEDAGADIVTERPTEEDVDYLDLSPEALDKNTFIDLLTAEE